MLKRILAFLGYPIGGSSRETVTVENVPSPERGGPLDDKLQPEEPAVCIQTPDKPKYGEGAVYIPITDLPTVRESIRDAPSQERDIVFTDSIGIFVDHPPIAVNNQCAVCGESIDEISDCLTLEQHTATNDVEVVGLHQTCLGTLEQELETVYDVHADELLGQAL